MTHAYPRWDGDVAGAFIERLVLALSARGHEVRVLAPADQGQGGVERRRGIEVRRLRYAPRRWETLAYRGTMVAAARSPSGALAALALVATHAKALADLAYADAVDVVHAHWWVPAGISAWLGGAFHRAPYVVTLHGTDVAILERSAAARTLARRVLRSAAALTAVSSYLADRTAALARLDRARILVQPMPADVGRFARSSSGGGGIVTVGRLSAQKRIALILEAAALLGRQGRPLPLTVVGDGPERSALERRAAELGLTGRTRFVGQVAPDRLPDAIGDADVFAFAAAGEGFGLAAAEALMLGVPVVAIEDGGGVLDVVPRTGAGRVVPAGDVPALARALGELAGDAQARRAAAQAGAELKRRLAPDVVAAGLEAAYAAALERREAGRA